uniref:Ig-like domain-containing protein n=1 Tax=Poecilia formosa TaxID=48698 RepID=A0A096LW74_POEFO
PSVTLQHNWPQIYRGETVTLRCEIQGGEGSQWTYEWRPTNRNSPSSNEFKINTDTESYSGEYQCSGRRNNQAVKNNSNTMSLSQSAANKPAATLTASNTIIPAGGSVTLTCSVGGSAGWKFDLLRQETVYLYTTQPIRTSEPDAVLSISYGGVYSCRGGRGDPVFYTETSDKVTIWKSVFASASNNPRATLTARDTIIPVGGSVTLLCSVDVGEGWKIYWYRNSYHLPWNIINDGILWVSDEGVYSCRGGRGDPVFYTEYSTNVTIHKTGEFSFCSCKPVLSVSPSWLSPGASVTLSCEVKPQDAGWRFFWYKAVPHPSSRYYIYELLANTTNGTEQNSYIINGPTHTAGYKCRAGRGEPLNYTDYSEPKFVWSADFLILSRDNKQRLLWILV